MIQILGLREYFNKTKQKFQMAEKFFEKNWRSPSVEDVFENYSQLLEQIPETERWNLYYTVSECVEATGRRLLKQHHIPIDIDGLELTDPVTHEQVLPIIESVAFTLGLPSSELCSLFSGNGVQILVGLEEGITDPEYFDQVRHHYKAICDNINLELKRRGLKGKADPSVWSPARLMRFPHTINRKKDKPERTGFILTATRKRHSVSIKQLSGLPDIPQYEQIAVSALRAMPKADVATIMSPEKGCAFLQHCQTNPNQITEPEWFAMLSITGRFPNGREFSHQMSKGHKGYTVGETDTKLDHALATSGPRTCKNINNIWGKCSTCNNFETDLVSPITIRGDDFILTEETGFWFTMVKEGVVRPVKPDYMGLLKKFIRDFGEVMTVEGTGGVWTFNGMFYEEVNHDVIEQYAAKKFDPLATGSMRTEFFNHVRLYKVVNKDFFTKSSEGKVNFQNGVLDIGTGEILHHSKDYGFLSAIAAEYDAEAVCPQWERFLGQVTEGDKGLTAILQEFVGYIIGSKDCRYQKGLGLYGTGSNGKSVFVNILKKLMSKQGYSSVSLEDMVNPQNRLSMEGKLVNISEENNHREAFKNTSVMKNMVTGGDINVKRLYAQPYQYENTTKLIMLFNKMPKTTDDSEGFFRRLILVPFEAHFSELAGNLDLDIEDKLATELPGILNWAIRGYERLTTNRRWSESERSNALLAEYRDQSNPLNEFIEDHIVFTEDGEACRNEIYEQYKTWAMNNGEFPKSARYIYDDIRKRYQLVRGKKLTEFRARRDGEVKRLFQGIRLSGNGVF